MKSVKLRMQPGKRILRKLELAARLHLSGDSAHILAAVQDAVIDAALNVSCLAPGNPADIVSDMLIAHGAVVDAGADHSKVASGDSADIRDRSGVLRGENVPEGKGGEIKIRVGDNGIYMTAV